MEIWGYLLRNRRQMLAFGLALSTTLTVLPLRFDIFGVKRRQVAVGLLRCLVPLGLMPRWRPSAPATVALPAVCLLASLLLSGCGFLAGAEATATPTPEERALVPTFTPTAVQPPTATPEPPTPTVVAEAATDIPAPLAEEPTALPTDTPAPATIELVVTGPVVNVRRGPGTAYGLVGSVQEGMRFEVRGRNAAGDWYQFCCVNGEEGWIYAPLVQVQNGEAIAVVQEIPPAPTAAPAAPTNPPPPAAPTATPAPPAAADPCANIGGDGCKFKVTGGPRSADNGGLELKLQLFFIHSGVDGGQPQGSYFLVLEKDGQRLPIPDAVRSVALQRSEGSLGPYNYEFKLGRDRLPGGNVAGNYTGWVLDGNGERDSRNFSFSLGDGQGQVWIQFDQS